MVKIQRENNWKLKTYPPFGLNIEDNVWLFPCRSINVTGGFSFLVFFAILIRSRTGMDLGQDFPDIFFCIYYIVYFLIGNLLFLCTLKIIN